jgi:hypothetical protein
MTIDNQRMAFKCQSLIFSFSRTEIFVLKLCRIGFQLRNPVVYWRCTGSCRGQAQAESGARPTVPVTLRACWSVGRDLGGPTRRETRAFRDSDEPTRALRLRHPSPQFSSVRGDTRRDAREPEQPRNSPSPRGFFGEPVLMMELPRRHATPFKGKPVRTPPRGFTGLRG